LTHLTLVRVQTPKIVDLAGKSVTFAAETRRLYREAVTLANPVPRYLFSSAERWQTPTATSESLVADKGSGLGARHRRSGMTGLGNSEPVRLLPTGPSS
jgi:hypothetical protein